MTPPTKLTPLTEEKKFYITLELAFDCSGYSPEDVDSAYWQLKVNGKAVGELNTYAELHKALDYILDLEEQIKNS